MGKTSKTKTKAKKKEAEEIVEENGAEDEDLELDEVDDEEVEDKPKKSKKDAKAVGFGVSDICKILKQKTGDDIKPRDLRTQLRRMARDGRIEREIVPGNKARYEWSGPNDPEVKKIIKAVLDGEIDEAKKTALADLKERNAKKRAKAAKEKKKAEKKKRAEDEDEDDE